MKTSEAVAEFLATLASEGRSPHTVAAYRRDLALFIRLAGNGDLASVTPAVLSRFMAHHSVQVRPCGRQRAPATVNRYRVALKALFAWAEARWLIERNPTAILKCRRHRGLPPAVLSEEEIEKVISHKFKGRHGKRDQALITFMLLTGCRLGETVGLDTCDIALRNGTAILRKPKGGDPDRIVLAKRCVAVLKAHLGGETGPTRPLFATASGRRLSTRQVQRIVAKRVAEVGLDFRVTPHTLRHTFATRLYNRTGDIRLVQQALRHEHVTTTEAYAQVDPKRWRHALERAPKTP